MAFKVVRVGVDTVASFSLLALLKIDYERVLNSEGNTDIRGF